MDNIEKVVGEALEKSLPEIVDAVTEKKFAQLQEKTVAELEEVKSELKKYALATKTGSESGRKAFKEAFIVSLMKDVNTNWVSNEAQFNEAVARTEKSFMNTTDAWEGAEYVFDQFEADILAVFDRFDVLNDVRIYNINKGDNLTLPTGENAVVTYKTSQGSPRTASEPGTWDIKMVVAKWTTMTTLSEEFFDDTMTIPDVYSFIVRCFGESQAKNAETQVLTAGNAATDEIKGIFTDTAVLKETIADVDAIDDDALIEVISKAEKKFDWNESFYMSKYIKGRIMKLKTLDGSPLYPEMRLSTPSLLGFPVKLSSVGFVQNVSEDVAGATYLMFGNLEYYSLLRRRGLTVERGLTGANFAEDKITVKSTQRVGGQLTFPEAIVLLQRTT